MNGEYDIKAAIARLGLDEDPWSLSEPVGPRSQLLILLAFLAIAAIAVLMWSQR